MDSPRKANPVVLEHTGLIKTKSHDFGSMIGDSALIIVSDFVLAHPLPKRASESVLDLLDARNVLSVFVLVELVLRDIMDTTGQNPISISISDLT